MTREEAIETIRRCCPRVGDSQCDFETALRELIPELRESEDERIRRTLVEYFGPSAQLDFIRGVPIQKIRDWLEKQKEQKPAEWSEEDETKLRDVVRLVEDSGHVKSIREHYEKFLTSLPERFNLQPKQKWNEEDQKMLLSIINDLRNGKVSTIGKEQWLKWLPERFTLQPKQEWSEEDEKMLNNLIWAVHMKSISPCDEMDDGGVYEKYENFLKSLRPSWKPSGEQEPEYYQHFDPDC